MRYYCQKSIFGIVDKTVYVVILVKQHMRKFHWNSMMFRLTRRDRLKSAPYLRLKNIQRTTNGKIWKKYF